MGLPLNRKQGLSQREQRKIQAIRRAHRLPSCSSEPLSPEDNYSSAASTPTTPCVNVIEEINEHHDTPEKSFKFPKFKKVGLVSFQSTRVIMRFKLSSNREFEQENEVQRRRRT
jgi:hypothetical protein